MAGTQPTKNFTGKMGAHEVITKPTGKMGGKAESVPHKKKPIKYVEEMLIKSSVARRTREVIGSNMQVSNQSFNVLAGIIYDIIQRTAEHAAKLAIASNRQTISGDDVLCALQLVLPGNLKQHCVAEVKEALAKHSVSKKKK